MLFLNNLVESFKTGFGEQLKINKGKIRSFFGFYVRPISSNSTFENCKERQPGTEFSKSGYFYINGIGQKVLFKPIVLIEQVIQYIVIYQFCQRYF